MEAKDKLERLTEVVERIAETVVVTTETVERLSLQVEAITKQIQNQGNQVQQQNYQIFAISDALQALLDNQTRSQTQFNQLIEVLQDYLKSAQKG
ncbi:MAG: hypothetical protein Cpurp_14220 [Chlorogloea purpurea SAG 13.99]|nr:hypothetical protein [Chlorogloea purpurea SAG 13.99]